jgi:hypothetical protein
VPRRRLTLFPGVFALLATACALELNGLGDSPPPIDAAAAPPESASESDATAPPTDANTGMKTPPIEDVVSIPADVSTPVDVAVPDAAPVDCDFDQDGYKAVACGGDDCCDQDNRAHPGDTSYFTSPDECGSFDYDCDGTQEPEFAEVNCMLGLLSCSGDGFDKTPPACGVVATFDRCDLGLLTCNTSPSQVAQGCR